MALLVHKIRLGGIALGVGEGVRPGLGVRELLQPGGLVVERGGQQGQRVLLGLHHGLLTADEAVGLFAHPVGHRLIGLGGAHGDGKGPGVVVPGQCLQGLFHIGALQAAVEPDGVGQQQGAHPVVGVEALPHLGHLPPELLQTIAAQGGEDLLTALPPGALSQHGQSGPQG